MWDFSTLVQIALGALQTYYAWVGTQVSAGRSKKQIVGVAYNQRLMVFITIITWGAILWGAAGDWAKQKVADLRGSQLESVFEKRFVNEVVVLDGHSYVNCIFENVTFEFNGGNFAFVNNTAAGVRFKSKNKDINSAISALAKFDVFKIPIMTDKGGLVLPGVTWTTNSR